MKDDLTHRVFPGFTADEIRERLLRERESIVENTLGMCSSSVITYMIMLTGDIFGEMTSEWDDEHFREGIKNILNLIKTRTIVTREHVRDEVD